MITKGMTLFVRLHLTGLPKGIATEPVTTGVEKYLSDTETWDDFFGGGIRPQSVQVNTWHGFVDRYADNLKDELRDDILREEATPIKRAEEPAPSDSDTLALARDIYVSSVVLGSDTGRRMRRLAKIALIAARIFSYAAKTER
jgi:formylmethanofuran:tetrahydromethanopterin formyltransferase